MTHQYHELDGTIFFQTLIALPAENVDFLVRKPTISPCLPLLPWRYTQPIVGVYFTALCRAIASSRTRLLDHTQRRVTVGRTPLNE
jgi:hypothetical protein